jgi:hypothetical protein
MLIQPEDDVIPIYGESKMSKNVVGVLFVSKGIKYMLDYGPKGNLRP